MCGWEWNFTNSQLQTHCLPFHHHRHIGASTPQVVAVVLGSCLLAIVVLAIYKGFVSDKLDKENQTRIKKFLEDYKAVKPSRYSYADIKRIIKQFKEELGQGAYWNRVQGMAIE
ncbi:hypothetical protein V6N12_024529 [Hibiscus sabdariffa]|uniref:Uncharacterized protein n=1 Tax=Hibiscus sabdariffa TaxID=183260 RepID=A0ABR2G1T3_9ROSI